MNPLLIVLLIVVVIATFIFLLYHFHVKAVVAHADRAVAYFKQGVDHANATRAAAVERLERTYMNGVANAKEAVKSAEHKL